jgi:hypothetical protein
VSNNQSNSITAENSQGSSITVPPNDLVCLWFFTGPAGLTLKLTQTPRTLLSS